MFGFGKKKDKNDILSSLKDLKKDALEIHFALQNKVKEYLLEDESVITEGRLGFNSYFVTDKRVIVIEALNKKLRGIQIASHYYNNIESVKYSEGVFKKLDYDIVTLNFKGSLKSVAIQLPREVTKEMYNIVNKYIANNAV